MIAANKVRKHILKILSESVPKEEANLKQGASKRCQALATFMESVIEEINRDELKLEMPISDRNSVMLGEISPHHDYYDSKSSSETPPSYKQLNYSENLNRFFESKPQDADEIVNSDAVIGNPDESSGSGSVIVQVVAKAQFNDCQSALPQKRFGSSGTGSAGNFSSSSHMNMGSTTNTSNTGTSSGSYQPPALTEALVNKHNDDMEKQLLKRHKESRATSRSEKLKKSTMEGSSKQVQGLQQCQLYVPSTMANLELSPGGHPGTSALQGTKRSGSHSWEGLESYHRISKHQHVGEHNGNKVPSAHLTESAWHPTNLRSVRPVQQIHSLATAARSPFTQQSATSLIRNIELWPPFSANLTAMRSPMAVQTNPHHASPGLFRTMYYIPPQPQVGHGSDHPAPLPPATSFPYMTGIMVPHTPLYGQQLLYHPTVNPTMIYRPVVPMSTYAHQPQPTQPQTSQHTSIDIPNTLFINSTGYSVSWWEDLDFPLVFTILIGCPSLLPRRTTRTSYHQLLKAQEMPRACTRPCSSVPHPRLCRSKLDLGQA